MENYVIDSDILIDNNRGLEKSKDFLLIFVFITHYTMCNYFITTQNFRNLIPCNEPTVRHRVPMKLKKSRKGLF